MSLTVAERAVGYALQKQPLTAAEFLAWDATQANKHEFVRGEVFAMTGAAERHVLATRNLLLALHTHLRGTPCRAMANDMKLRVEAADCFYYPDLLVSCQPSASGNDTHKNDAVVVVEVLSPSTAAFDRGDKFADYRLLPGLREYLLIDPDKRRCDLYRKGADGLWVLHPSGSDEPVHLASVDLSIAPATLWEDLPPMPATS
jgi:Uma2 family endonuclease